MNLSHLSMQGIILRTSRHSIEPHRITAPEPSQLGPAMRALSDHRAAYFQQSANTKAGQRAEYVPPNREPK